MKYLLFILYLYALSSSAIENRVLNGKAKQVSEIKESGVEISKGSFIDELTLETCNVNVYSLNNNLKSKITIRFSNREFIADSLSFNLNANGECVINLENGKSIK
ncbi:hypothetical protein [Thalassotalea ganghwensis]